MKIGAEGRNLIIVTVAYVTLTFLMALPFSLSPGSTILGDVPDAHVYLWTLGWDAYAFLHQPLHIFPAVCMSDIDAKAPLQGASIRKVLPDQRLTYNRNR